MATQYRVVPFRASIQGGMFSKDSIGTAAQQLQELINRVAGEGWDYVGIEQVNVSVAPGCLAALLKQSHDTIAYDMVVFRRGS